MKKFKKGDTVYTKATGYGLVSYEKYTVERVSKGKIKVEDLDTLFDEKTGRGDGASLGLAITIAVTPADIKAGEKYVAENG